MKMAGNKINSKTKGRDEKGKVKNSNQLEDAEENDFSILRRPITTSVTGFAQARKIFDAATEELQEILSNECDLLYECKVCRNIFRSLANFLSHKRVFCKDKFKPSSHGHFINPISLANEIQKIKNLEDGYQEYLKQKNQQKNRDHEDGRILISKDLTSVIEQLANNKEVTSDEDSLPQLTLQKIDTSSVAVFQTTKYDKEQTNSMKAQVEELDKILSQDKAILQSDGSCVNDSSAYRIEPEGVIHISDDDDSELICRSCNIQFSTQKTYKFHMKFKHLESRLVYPCPECLDIFSTSWSVYRHLFKVHRKTPAQIRRLRESIQAKAFKMDNPPAFYERRKNVKPIVARKLTEEERQVQENQAWMSKLESEGQPRCLGCGRSFERRAALNAHTHTCQPRHRAIKRNEHRRIQIQIRKDYHKEPNPNCSLLPETKQAQNENTHSLFKNKEGEKPLEEATMFVDGEEHTSDMDSNSLDSPEKSDDSEPAEKTTLKTKYSDSTDKLIDNMNVLKQKMNSRDDVDVDKLACKKCDTKCQGMDELCDHIAEHYNWMRYACKLCNFKNYLFDSLVEHVKTVHKLRNDSDFYDTTVKALSGAEALELFNMDNDDTSRRQSTDSRVSDDSSNSSVQNNRKRRVNTPKIMTKKRKEELDDSNEPKDKLTMDKVMEVIFGDDGPNKSSEDISSTDIVQSLKPKRKRPSLDIALDPPSLGRSRRPVRNRAKPKNEDFEYDLSNLLKKEAQGYREQIQQSIVVPKPVQIKKKPQFESSSHEIKESPGALLTMSKKSAVMSKAHIKPTDLSIFSVKASNIFVRPKILKAPIRYSPKKFEDKTDVKTEVGENQLNIDCNNINEEKTVPNAIGVNYDNETENSEDIVEDNNLSQDKKGLNEAKEHLKSIRTESMELVKKTNNHDSGKLPVNTKILVIKPINRNNDGNSTPLKFQRIKLKDQKILDRPDQIKLVKVPSVNSIGTKVVIKKPVVQSTLIQSSIVQSNVTNAVDKLLEKTVTNASETKVTDDLPAISKELKSKVTDDLPVISKELNTNDIQNVSSDLKITYDIQNDDVLEPIVKQSDVPITPLPVESLQAIEKERYT